MNCSAPRCLAPSFSPRSLLFGRLIVTLWIGSMIPAPALGQPAAPVRDYSHFSLAELGGLQPEWPNPYLSFLPAEAQPDYRYWDALMAARERDLGPPGKMVRTVLLAESEPNDSAGTADDVPGFGTGAGEDPAADVTGTFAPPPAPTSIGPFGEDDGSISLASATGLTAGGSVTFSRTFGTADDEDVDFVSDMFNATERFAGTEDTLAVVACGCSGGLVFNDGFESGTTSSWDTVVP